MTTSKRMYATVAVIAVAAGSLAVATSSPASAGGRRGRPAPVATQPPSTTPCVIPDYTGKLYWQVAFDNVNCNMNYADSAVPNPTEGKIISVGSSASGPFFAGGSVLPHGTIVWVNYESSPACNRCHW
jgi:hypothetical protein